MRTNGVLCALKGCARSFMLILAILNVFQKAIYKEYFPTPKWQLAYRAGGAMFTPTIQYGWFCKYKHVFVLLIDRLVCIMQNNQTLDV